MTTAEHIVEALLEGWSHKIITPSIVFADGTTFEGPLHSTAKLKATQAGRDLEHEEFIEGFLTNAGEFLDRDQARAFADEQGIETGGEGPLHATHLASFWEAMSPEEFMRGHMDKWHFSIEGEGEHWVILNAKKGLEDVGGFNTPRFMVPWYQRYLLWLDDKWPWESYRDAINREGTGVVDWMNASFQRGFRERYEQATGEKMPERRPERLM